MTTAETTERLRKLCAEVGFDFARMEPFVAARLALLAELTETVSDSERMVARARDVFRYYEVSKPERAFSGAERRIVVLGCLFSDIGKTGPLDADPRTQRLFVEMFSVEGVRDETQPVARFLSTYFPADHAERVERFTAAGLEPRMTMRAFWNLHSTWTLAIVEAGGVPAEVIAAAATHHLLEDINPQQIVGSDQRFTRAFGDNTAFDRAEKLVLLLDKYDAARRRSHKTHQQAIAWLRERVENHPTFRTDPELTTLISDLEAALDH
jgi:hypothetical protein